MNPKEVLRAFAATTLSVLITSLVLPGVHIKLDLLTVTLTVLVLSFVNILLKPLIKIIAIPINFVSLGLFNIIINGALLYLVTYLVDGFTITDGILNLDFAGIIINNMYLPWYWMLLLATVIISLINWILKRLIF